MRLKELRKRRGISQLKLAMDLSMNQNSISRYESGAREADYATLIKFADYFNVSIDYLLGVTDNPKPIDQTASVFRLPAGFPRKALPELTNYIEYLMWKAHNNR